MDEWRLVAALIGLAVGTVTGALWSRWRHQVVSELRIIRRLMEAQAAAATDRRPPKQ